ncbi:MAG: L-fucose/L-arabinose isomerase family protein [Spirochaeta sp.]|jgi:L-fucose isomerase-like protein|nr:L-fucose/L-arabinose isomerase family protein [Spirochaeta sp.]
MSNSTAREADLQGDEARAAGVIEKPVIGLMIMGRKRPGFDPEWGAAVQKRIAARLKAFPWHVVTPSQNIADQAELKRAVEQCRQEGVATLLLVQPTISDGRLAPLLSRLWDKPLVLWATTEKPSGAMISANSLVGTHVMAATLRQLGHPLEIVYGDPDDSLTQERLRQAISAVHAADAIVGRSVGLIGYHAPGFVDFHTDPVFLNDSLASQLYHLNTPELIDRVQSYTDDQIAADLAAFKKLGVPEGPDFATAVAAAGSTAEEALAMQARYYRAFRDYFAEERFDVLAFRCWPDLPTVLGHWPYFALARLVSEGFPIAMEGDVDGALCSRIAESAEIGPVYLSDWLEHDHNSITIWHTGAAPFQLCEPIGRDGGPRLGVQFNNKKPTVVEASIKSDEDVTAFRIWRYDGEYHMTALEGRTEKPRRELMATNGRFVTDEVDVRDWFEEMVQIGMPHHLCIVHGHYADTLRRVARLTGMEWV